MKNVRDLLNQASDIAKGVSRKLFPDKRYSVLYAMRAYECHFCEHKTSKLGVDSCSICGCFIPLKIRCVSGTNDCPMNKWIRQGLFGGYKYKHSVIRKGKDSLIAQREVEEIISILRYKLRIYGTRKFYREAYKLSLHVNKAYFEQGLKELMERYYKHPKSKFREKNMYQFERTIRELNTALKSGYILSIYNSENSDNVKKNR